MTESEQAWEDALLAIRVAAIARHRIGGIHVRARSGPARDAWVERFREALPDIPVLRFSPEVDEGRLLGDLDLSRTLAEGRPVMSEGLLTRAHGGAVMLAMAERAEPTLSGIVAGAMDTGSVTLATGTRPAQFLLIALDEGADETETVPLALDDRLGLRVDLATVSWRIAQGDVPVPEAGAVDPDTVTISDPMLGALAGAAVQAGWQSMRPALWLTMVARIVAAIDGKAEVAPDHATTALRLVFGPVAIAEETEAPAESRPDDAPPPDRPDVPPPPPESDTPDPPDTEDPDPLELDSDMLQDMMVAAEAARSMQLPILLPAQAAGANARGSGKAGAKKDKARRGRPVGFTPTPPFPGARPHILATLRAAAPWQKLRAMEAGSESRGPGLDIRKSDFRYTRLRDRSETTVIFAVDASGSTALARLGEAKGAVEMLLAECYIRRDSVAVIAFRGTEADVLLEPTRSLVRAKRALGRLPGGGPTPLASAMARALEIATRVLRDGSTPLLVMMTDGNGNIALDGTADRAQSREDVAALSRRIAVQPMQKVMIDISARPRESARAFAAGLHADYVALPRADAGSVSRLVSSYMGGR